MRLEYEQQQAFKESDPKTYREWEEKGRIIPYDVSNLELDKIWLAFGSDPNVKPMKPVTTAAS